MGRVLRPPSVRAKVLGDSPDVSRPENTLELPTRVVESAVRASEVIGTTERDVVSEPRVRVVVEKTSESALVKDVELKKSPPVANDMPEKEEEEAKATEGKEMREDRDSPDGN